MNAIFKVLWNKARGQFVATDETKTAFGKGKVRSTVQKGLSTLLLSALAAGSVSAAGVVSGWGSTTVTADQANKVLNVTTSKYVNDGKTGINKFREFTVNADQIANLQFGTSQQLLNLVNAKIEIDGVVNAVKNNKIGGDLYFVSPVGMVVGTTGVINAGSLTTTITTQDQFNTWSNLANGDQPRTFNDAFLQNLRTGDGVPINPAGVITVKGSINAGNSLALLAGSVQITSGARLTTGVTNFQDLVNIRGADGQVTTSANLEKELAFETDPDTGDVLLFARAAGDLAADAETQTPESGEKTDGKGTAVAASVVVEEGAVVKAAGDLTAKAYAGNGAVNLLADDPILFKSSDGEGRDVSASVELLGTVRAEGKLTAEARAFNIVDHSTSFIGKALETIQSGFVPIDTGTIEYVDMSADARVTVGEKAEVTGVKGLTLESEAHSDLKVGDQSGFKNFLNWGKAEEIPVVSAAAMRVKNTSAVEIKGALATDGELKLAAAGDLKVDASVKAATSATKAPQASFIYADLDAGTTVSVADGASISAAGTSALGPSKVTVEAKQTNRVETDAETNTPPTGNIALAVNITKFNASAQANLGEGFTSSGTADVRATNETETLKVRAKTTVGDYGIQMKIMDFGSNLAFGKVADSLAGVFGTSAGGSATTAKFQLGGAAAYVKNAQSATVTIAPNVQLQSTGKFTVEAKSDLADHHYEAVTKQVIDNEKGNVDKDKQGALAILINEAGDGASSLASVTVGDGASIKTSSSGDLTLTAEALINKDRFEFLKKELIDCFNAYAAHFSADAYQEELAAFTAAKDKMVEAFDAVGQAENFTTGITQLQTAFEEFSSTLKALMSLVGEGAGTASDFIDFGMSVLDFLNPASYTNAFVSAGGKTYKAQADNPFSVAGSLAVLDQTTKSAVEVGAGAALESAQALGLTATSRNESIAMGGQLDNFLGVPLPNIDKGTSLGASVVYHELGTDNLILVKEGAALSGTKTDLNANDELDGVTIAASAGYNTGTLSASGMAAVTEADAKNRIAIDDEARIEATLDDLTIKALRDDSVQTVAGALSFVKSVDGAANAVGAGVAVNLGSFGNTLEMKDLDGTTSIGDYGAGALKAGGTLALTAESGLSLNAVGLTGQAGVSGSGSANTKKPDAAGDLSALGSQTGSTALTGAASGLAEGGALQSAVSSGAGLAAAQAGGDAAGADGSYSGLETGNPSSGIASAGSVTSGIQAAGSSFQLSAAGSFAWNDVKESNVLHIEGATADQDGMITLDAQKTAVESVTNKWVGAFAGGAAVSVSKGGSGTSVGIGGAAAVNQNNAENRLTLKNVSLSEKVENMGVYSLVNGTTVAQGLGVAVSTSGGPAGAIDAGVSVNLIKNTVSADVEGLSVRNESGEFEYAQTAWTGEVQVTGGTTVGVASGSGGFSGAVGAAVAVADIDNTVASTIKGANFTNVKSVDVKALASLTQVNTAVGVQAAVGSGSGAALNGSIISADITNIVNASAEDSQASLAKDGSFTITARDAGTGDGEEAHAYAERAKGRTGLVEEDKVLNRSLLEGVQIAEDDSGSNYRDLSSDFLDGSGMTQVSAAISVAATGGSSGGAGGAGVVVTDFENTFGASSKGLTVTHDGSGLFSEKAQSDVVTVAVAAGAAGTSGNFSASGSVIVSDVTQTAQASAEDLTLTAGAMKDDAVRAVLAAQTNAKTVNVAGNVSVQVSAGGGGLGAAVVVAEVENNALTTLKKSTISSFKDASAEDGSTVPGALGLLAENNSEIWTAAAAATISSNAALGASVAVNRAVGNAQIDVDAVTLDGLERFDAQARDDSELWTLSGAVSAAVKPGAAAGAGLAFASSRGSTKADVNGLTLLASEEKTDIGVSAEAQDHVSTLTLAVGAGGSVGLSGAAAKNVVERTVAADLTGLKTNNEANEADETIEGAGDVVVRAESRADIDNLALVAAASQAAALGAGVAVNTIDVDVAAGAHDLKAGVSSLNVAAHSANDIDTIGVGGAGAGTIAAAGSTAFNTITGDTSASLTDSILHAADAVAVHAESDDVIGTYAGQGVGAGTIALGLSVAMSERSGATTATVSGSAVKETGTGIGTLTMKSGVDDTNINNAIVEQDALNVQTSLEDKRAEEKVDGIAVSATSATTYKTLTINGGGAGSAQAAGTASIVTHAGKTEAGVSQSTLESAGKLAVEAGDYANFSSVLVTAGGAGGISANGSVTQTDAAHATRAAVEDSALISAATTLSAEAKEGVSNLTIAAGGAGAIAVDAVVAIANQKSSVVTALTNSTVAGGAYTQKADYLGRLTNLGVSAAGAGALAGAATVAINTADVVVKSVVDGGSVVKPAGAVSIEAGRTLDWNEYGGAAAASGAGAVAGTVYINETAGETLVLVDDAQLGDGTNQVTLSAKNDDSIELVAVSAAGAKYVAAGATVAVNTMAGDVGTMVKNASLKGTDVKVEALADRKAKSTLVSASASLGAGLAANVFSTRVGGTGSYAELLGDGDTGTSATLEKFKSDYGALSKKDLTTGAAGGASDGEVMAKTEAKSNLVSGTGVMSVDSTFEGSNSVTLAAKEDAKEGSGIDAELGLGTAGSVGIGASVVTVDRVIGASVTMSGGGISAKTAEITASVGADDSLKVHQGSAGLVGGNASYVREQVSGGVTAVVENQANVKGESVVITAKNDSSVTADAFGVAAGAVAVGAQIAKIKDDSSVVVKLENSNFEGDVKATVDRAQRLHAEATAGYGGAVAGAGAVTEISDSGKAQATLSNISASGASFETAVNLHPELSVKSYAAGGALGVSAGVVKATAEESGEATLVVTGGELKSDEVKLSALAGEKTDKESDALRLTGRVEGYGGAVVAGLNFNTVNLSNTAKASLSVDGTAFRAAEGKIAGTAAQLRTGGYGLYDASADAVAAGGILAAGSNDLTVVHGLESEMTLKGSASTLGSLDAAVENAESAKILGESAGGALINADANDAVHTTHKDTSSAALTVAGSFTTAGDMSFEAASNSDLLMTADNTKGGLAALSGAVGTNTMKGSTAVRVTDGAALSAGGDLRLGALNAWTLGAASGDHLVKSEVYGAIAGGGIKFANTVERSADVSVGKKASLFAGDSITAEAKSTGDADVRVLARTAGAFNAVGATVESSVKNANTVSVASGAVLRTQSTEGVVALAATGEDVLEHEALTRIEGSALANADSKTNVTVERTNTVSLESGAEIRSGGEVLLNAGAAADGTQSKLEMQNRAESFSYAFLSGISADLNAKTKLSGIVDVAGKVVSTTNTAVTGDSGDYMITGDSLSHYWGQLKADDKSTLAVKGSGKKDAAVEETGRISVTGSIDAGVNTKADIVISGLLNPEGSDAEIAGSQSQPTVKVEAGTEEAKESILSSISGPVSESEGNVYWERYAELEKILREYTGATKEAIVGYQAEFEALAALMEQKGLGEWVTLKFEKDGQEFTQRTFVPIEKSEELYVAVNGITVSGGSIKLNAAEVTGSGAISANAAEGVRIKNESNASLKVGDIVIQAKGGEIELNGVAADESALKEAGFQGNVRSSDNTADPVIRIESEAQTGSYTVKHEKDESGKPFEETVTPSTNLVLTGEIRNNAGDVSISAKDGDLVSLGDVGASGTLTLTAKGSIMQSYTSGLTNIGGDVPGNAWQTEIGQISSKDNYDSSKDPSKTFVSSNAQAPSGGKWVAGGAIIISGDLINLNGTIQSGYDTYELKINETVLEAKISEIREAWRRAGSPTNIDVKSSAYRLQAEEAVKTDDGSYKLLVAAWYDPVKDRIVMDDVLPEGGSIFITGKIASTGGGKIFASDGSADVRFNAGDHDVLTGRIDTGSSKGVVQFTDLFWSDSTKGTGAKVTRWQDGKTTEYMVDHNGQAIGNETVRNGIQNYSPKDGLLYVWTEGMVSGSTETQYYEYMAKWWGEAADKLQDAFETEKKTITKSGNLYQGATITDQLTRPNKGSGQDDNFYAWMDVLDQTDTGYQVTTKKWKTGFLGCHKWTSYTITRDTTSKRMVTYTVKADKDVSVGFLKGSNTVDITSNRSIHLGNSITAQGGTIRLNAGGDIRAESAGASLNGADTINLTAKGDIGSSLRPIALKGGSGELKLGATAANIHIDGTNLGAGRNVSSDGLLAGSTLSVAVRGDLQAAEAQGKDVTLSSVEGGVKVKDLRQLEAAGTHAVNISALNDVEVTASAGDLGLGLIESKLGDVVLTVQNGSVYDASGAADASDVSDEKRLEAWERAGLINADGSSTGDTLWQADVEAEKNRITQAYARMESYQAFKEKGGELTDAQNQDYTALQAIYGGFESAEAAVSAMEKDENSSLGKLVASRENYGWTENDLLYSIADTIINSEGSSTTTARATNVRGKNVEINAANAGSVGEVGETVTGRLSDEDETKRLTLLKALSRADIGDFSSKDGVVSVTLKIPVTIEASGNLTVNARDNIFLESPEGSGLAVKEIVSKTGDVRVTSRGGISAAEGSGLVSGNTVTLRGGTGGIGAADAYLKIHSDPAKWAAVNAGGDIFIEAVDANGALGDMTLYSLAGDKDVSLKANNLYAYSGDKLGDDYDDFAELGYIQGQTLNFEVLGDFGTEDTALRVGTASTVNFSESVGNVRLRGMGESGELAINGINASGVVDIDSEGGLKVGAVKGDSVELDAVKQITLTGNLESTGENKDLAVTSKEAGIELADNSTVRSKGGVKLDAKAGELKFTGGVVEASGDASLLGKSVTATQGKLSAGGRIEVGATGGGIDAAGLQTQAGAGTLITAVGGGVALSGGSSIEAAGDVNISSEGTLDLANATVQSTAGKVELNGLAGVVAKDATLLAAEAVTVTANENVEVSNSTVEAASLAITAAKSLTGTELKSKITGAAAFTAGENLVLDSADLSGGTVSAVAAQGLSALGAAINATEGTLTLTAEAADIDASSATLTAKDEVKLTANQSITAEDASVEAASLAMTANTGSVKASGFTATVADKASVEADDSVTLDGSKIGAGALTATAKTGDLSVKEADIKATTGGITLTAEAADIDASSATLTAKDEVKLTAKQSITATEASVEADSLTMTANTGSVEATGFTATVAGQALVEAGDSVTLDGSKLGLGALTASAKSGDLSLKSAEVDISGAAELTAKQSITATEASVEAASLAMTAETGSVEASGLTATVADQASVVAGDTVVLDNAELTAGALTATASLGDLSVKDAVITATKGGITLTAEAADIDASSAKLTAEGEVKLTAQNSITATDASVESASLAMTANTGSVEATGFTATVADQASVVAGDTVVLDNAELTAGALTATANLGDLSMTSAELDISGAAKLTAQDTITATDANVTSNSLTMTANTGSVEASGLTATVADQASVVAGDTVVLDNAELTAGALTATANLGDLSMMSAELDISDAAELTAKQSITATDANLTSNSLTMTAVTGKLDGSRLTTTVTGQTSVQAGDSVTLDNAELTAGALTATANLGDLSLKSAELDISGAAKLTAQDTITATDANVTSDSLTMTAKTGKLDGSRLTTTVTGQASVEAGDSVTLDGSKLGAGALTATANLGDLSLKSAELDISGAAKLTAQDTITATDANVTSNSLTMTAKTGSVEASRLTATVADQASIVAGNSVTLDGSKLGAGALTATATTGDLSVKNTEIKAAKGGITLTAEASDIDASGVNLSAVGAATLTAGQDLKLAPSGDAVARVTAKSLSATASGALDASRLEVKVEEASAFQSNGLLTLTDANVSGGSLRAEGDAGVEGARITVDVTGNGYNEGNRDDYEGVVTFKSSKGPITLTGADVKADKGDFFARSEGNLNVETARFEIQDGGLGFKSTGGDLTLAGAIGLKGDFLEMEAHGSIGMEDMELSVEEILRISAGGDINSRNLQLEITEDENGVGGKAYFEATTGTVHLEGSTITAKTSDGFIGDMTVIAGKDARLDDVFTPEKNVKAESMSIRAGDAVNFGEGTVALETKRDLTVEADHLTGDRIAAESVLASGSALSISVKEDLHVEEGVQASGQNVKFSSKDFTLADRTTVRGGSTAEIDASGEVAFTGDVLVTADDSVGIGAASGGITFTGAVTVGDETKSENKAKVTLHAAGSILQQEVSGNAGVRGSSLEAQSSGGFVKLDAREGGTSGEGGNAFTKAEIESAGDVVFGSTGRTTELAVNASKNGAVSGDLRVQGERGAVIFTNGVSASGEVAVNAAAVHGSDLSADGRLAIVTALEKNAPKGAPQGIVFSGGLSGSIVTVYAGSGDVVIEGPVRSTLGEVDVYRLDQTERGVVRVGEADSAHTLVVFNARGDVVAGPMHSADTLYAFAGWEGRVYGRSGFTSDVHKAGAVEHAEPIGLVPDLSEWLNLDAAELDPSALPRLSFTARNLEYADTDRIGPWRFLLEDLTTPLGSWLFLRLRPDAAEDDQADEALLEGFPARKDGVIRDLREPTKEDFGWIMTSL